MQQTKTTGFFIRALPSLGKTTLLKQSIPGLFSDTDEIVQELFHEGPSHTLTSRMRADEAMETKFAERIASDLKLGINVLTNIEPWGRLPGLAFRVAVEPADYVARIKAVSRHDLLEHADEITLNAWAQAYKSLNKVVWLNKEQHLADLFDLRLSNRSNRLVILPLLFELMR